LKIILVHPSVIDLEYSIEMIIIFICGYVLSFIFFHLLFIFILFILCDTYPAREIDKDMVKISMTTSVLIAHYPMQSLPSGKNINNDIWITPN